MSKNSILVADSSETFRKNICELLGKRGYKIYEATDGAGAIRISRSIHPNLVILDVNLWGIQAYEVGKVIESDRLSTVIYMTNNLDKGFYEILKGMNVFAYIMKPIQAEQLFQTVEFSIMNSNKISTLERKVEKLESTLEGRKKVERAKGILMEKLDMKEKEAFQMLRKKSMDKCVSLERIAEAVIKKYG